MQQRIWRGAAPGTAQGHRLAVYQEGDLHETARRLARALQSEALKIGAGEHLAAIWLSHLLGRPPAEVDSAGGVDQVYQTPNLATSMLLPDDATVELAVEVKSAKGDWRRSTAQNHPEFSVEVGSLRDQLELVSVLVLQAEKQLQKKVRSGAARLAFAVIHPFDSISAEQLDDEAITHSVLGHMLPAVGSSIRLDAVGILWYPDAFSTWWRGEGFWRSHVIEAAPGLLLDARSPLMRIEESFLVARNVEKSSPWQFLIE